MAGQRYRCALPLSDLEMLTSGAGSEKAREYASLALALKNSSALLGGLTLVLDALGPLRSPSGGSVEEVLMYSIAGIGYLYGSFLSDRASRTE